MFFEASHQKQEPDSKIAFFFKIKPGIKLFCLFLKAASASEARSRRQRWPLGLPENTMSLVAVGKSTYLVTKRLLNNDVCTV